MYPPNPCHFRSYVPTCCTVVAEGDGLGMPEHGVACVGLDEVDGGFVERGTGGGGFLYVFSGLRMAARATQRVSPSETTNERF
jgi:hypothetical protein